jgi:hypothetical protein
MILLLCSAAAEVQMFDTAQGCVVYGKTARSLPM